MKSNLKSYDLNRVLSSVAKRFDREIHHDCQKRRISLQEEPAQGTLCAYDFEDGVQMLVLDGILPESWEIAMESSAESPFLLYFCVRGGAEFSYGGLEEPIVMQPMKTIMAAHPAAPQLQWRR